MFIDRWYIELSSHPPATSGLVLGRGVRLINGRIVRWTIGLNQPAIGYVSMWPSPRYRHSCKGPFIYCHVMWPHLVTPISSELLSALWLFAATATGSCALWSDPVRRGRDHTQCDQRVQMTWGQMTSDTNVSRYMCLGFRHRVQCFTVTGHKPRLHSTVAL